jgi:hypothetical protein
MSEGELLVDHSAIEQVVLEEVLMEHPLQLTEEEVVQSCNPDEDALREDALGQGMGQEAQQIPADPSGTRSCENRSRPCLT